MSLGDLLVNNWDCGVMILSSVDGCMGSIKEVHKLANSNWRSKPVSDMPTSQSYQLVFAWQIYQDDNISWSMS